MRKLVMTCLINNREVKYYPQTGIIKMRDYNYKDKPWKIKKCSCNGKGYLRFKIGNKKYYLHRVVYKMYHPEWDIEDISKDNQIDHKNHNREDNRIVNLRNVTDQENHFNRKDVKGYCWDKRDKKWVAKIRLNKKTISLGYYEKEEDARNAYLAAKEIHHKIGLK
jgi:hypothetical protein